MLEVRDPRVRYGAVEAVHGVNVTTRQDGITAILDAMRQTTGGWRDRGLVDRRCLTTRLATASASRKNISSNSRKRRHETFRHHR